jgi:CheY-like chemotaxis protein
MQKRKQVLLVENDVNDIELTLTALAEFNLAAETDIVRDGAEALDYLYCRGPYDYRVPLNPAVILLDLKMPKIDGLEVLRQIKEDPNLHTIPIVALTSSREEKDIVLSYKLGVNAYVVKPVNFNEFVESVKRLGLFWLLTNESLSD